MLCISLADNLNHTGIVKTIFLVLEKVYYRRFKCNVHNNYDYKSKTKLSNFNYKLFITEEEAPSKLGLG